MPELREPERRSRLRFGLFEIDARSGELRRDGGLVRLPPQPFKVLWLLASRAGEVVTREEIRQELWGQETFVDFDGSLNFCINQVRKALRDSAESPRFVHTLPRRGYRFIASVEPVRASEGASAPPQSPAGAAEIRRADAGHEAPIVAIGRGAARVLVSTRFSLGAPRPLPTMERAPREVPGALTRSSHASAARGPARRVGALLILAIAATAGGLALLRGCGGPVAPVYQRLTFRHGVVSGARFGPEGRVLYSASWDGAPHEVFTVRPGAVESLSAGVKHAWLMAALPSGDVGVILHEDKASQVLARAPLGGGAPRALRRPVWEAAWLGDELAAVVVRRGTEDHLEFPPGRVVYHAHVRMANLRVSPDGRWAAFLEQPVPGDDRGSVVVVDRQGRRRELTGGWASLEGLAWAPDGPEVWFTGTRVGADSHLNAVSLAGAVRLLDRGPGRMVLHDVDAAGRALVERYTRRLEVRGRFPSGGPERDLAWLDHSMVTDIARDGSSVVISESGEGGGAGYSVFLRPTDGAPPVRLGEGRAQTLSPDGRWILSIPVAGAPRILALPTGAGDPRVLGDGLTDHAAAAWYPDSRRILFAAAEGGRPLRFWRQDLEGGPPKPVTPENMAPWRPHVTPDGAWLLARSAGHDGRWSRYPAEAEGGAPRLVPGLGPDDVVVGSSLDGRSLHVTVPGPSPALERLDPGTGAREKWRVLPLDASGTSKVLNVCVTPDALHFVYTLARASSELYLVDGLR